MIEYSYGLMFFSGNHAIIPGSGKALDGWLLLLIVQAPFFL